ncbi:MAG TPA: GTP cyclohydrolase I FolE [Thermodesulfobacteriota bacterium]|nr:GTP cyclohydrolase I FolE [Thermodesulfobacteriota bacterium]
MSIEKAIKEILLEIGEDPERQGLKNTPDRIAKMYKELTVGYRVSPQEIINGAIFDIKYDEMVIVKDIEFYSLCEHHLLPFFGTCHVAYIPNGKIIGLSKVPRIVEVFSRKLQIQEKMTVEIADFLDKVLKPEGVAVVAEAYHLCMAMRGIKKAKAKMLTSAMHGVFKEDERTRIEFLSFIGKHR